MRHRLFFLNLLLAGLTAAAGWRLREDWLRDHRHASLVLQHQVKPAAPPLIAVAPLPVPFVAPAYGDVAQKDLFAKDRNPNVVVEPVVVKPRPKWPPMPILYGVMGLPGGMVALLAEKPDARSKGVRVGDSIGELKLVALSADKLSFEFDGDVKEKKVDELIDRGGHEPEAAGGATASSNPANVAAQRNGPAPPPKPGAEIGAAGASMKACQPGGEAAPAGTVVDGYKLIKEATPFGEACRWLKQ